MEKNNDDLMEIKAFEEAVEVTGKTYYDSHSRYFSVIRMPATLKHLFPRRKKQKTGYRIVCFPDKESLIEYLKTNNTLPLLLSFHAD
jgi:hypothetical protein